MEYDLNEEDLKKARLSMLKKPNSLIMWQDKDGNWRGAMNKGGRIVQARQADPGTVMQLLITHE